MDASDYMIGTESETVEARLARLCPTHSMGQHRLDSLAIAHPLVDDALFARLATVARLSKKSLIVLPSGRYEHLSRGKGWARKGRGDSAEWGERGDSGYRVGPGSWVVGSSDGYSRKDQTPWKVQHVKVGEATWTIAS